MYGVEREWASVCMYCVGGDGGWRCDDGVAKDGGVGACGAE